MTKEEKQEQGVDPELVSELISTLRVTVANQQVELVDLRARLSLAESRLEKLKTSQD